MNLIKNQILNQFYDILAEIQTKRKLVTCKVLAHTEILVNEAADKVAKEINMLKIKNQSITWLLRML